jgi:hypothetical protein
MSEVQAPSQLDRGPRGDLGFTPGNLRGFQIRTACLAAAEIEPPRQDMQKLD